MHDNVWSIPPSLISCLPRESVKAVAGREIYRLEMVSLCQAEKPIRLRPDCVCVTVRIGLLVVLIKRRRLPPTESANSPTSDRD